MPLLAREVALGLQLLFPGATAAVAEHAQTTDCASAHSDVPSSLGASAGAAHKEGETLHRPTQMLAHDAEHTADQLLRGLSEDFINLVDWYVTRSGATRCAGCLTAISWRDVGGHVGLRRRFAGQSGWTS